MNSAASTAVKALSFGFRDRGGSLQQARATASLGWCAALILVVALFENPFVLAAVFSAVIAVAINCHVQRDVGFVLMLAAPIAVLMAMVNPVATQNGVTVLVAGLHLPLLGTFDITREAVNYGVILGFRSVVVFAICGLYVATVDPDQLLQSLRRHSVRSAITASLAVRFAPMLARDGANLAMARECRPGTPPSTATIVRGTFARSLDRASDAALALETRGYALARPLRTERPSRRRVDWLVVGSAAIVALLAACGLALNLATFDDYPLTVIASEPLDLLLAVMIGCAAAIPAFVHRIPAKEGA